MSHASQNNIINPSFVPTQEQADIFDEIKSGTGHVTIRARAGCGKTSTAVESIKYIRHPKPGITFLCFNKHIQEEISKKVPEDIWVYTTHGLGVYAFSKKYGWPIVNDFKVHEIVRGLAKKWGMADNVYQKKIVDLVGLCKKTLSLKENQIRYIAGKYMIPIEKDSDRDVKRVLKALELSVLNTKVVDYNDMVFMPAFDNKIWLFPQDFIYVDEAQDLSKAQHYMIMKMLKRDKLTKAIKTRIFSFGDPFQSIMSFAGSDNLSFDFFMNMENTKILPLTYTFRCAKAIVAHANTIVSDIKALDKAVDGLVSMEGNVLEDTRPGDFVLCRKTRPLVRLFFELFLRKKKAIIKGSDLGKRILEVAKKYKTKEDMVEDLEYQLLKLREELIQAGVSDVEKNFQYADYRDFVGCIEMIAKTIREMSDIKIRIRDIFGSLDEKDDYILNLDAIVLSTVHKSKGLEADRVFIIKPQDLPLKQPLEWMQIQEDNLHYVAITRAKRELYYDWKWTDEKDEKKQEQAAAK